MAWKKCKLCQAFYDDKAYYARRGLCYNCMAKLEGVYNKVHDYMAKNEISTFNPELIAREVKEDPEEIRNLFELGFLERDIQTYSTIKTERQELAGKFSRELSIMNRRRKITTYGGMVYGR